MRKQLVKTSVILTVALSFTLTSCIGSFPLFNKLKTWNSEVGAKGVNELIFVAFWIIPVYEVAMLSDLLVLNSIEFWSGDNPIAKGTRKIETESGTYLVKCDGKGYDIIGHDGNSLRLNFVADDNAWDIIDTKNNENYRLMTWIDTNHIALPLPGGDMMVTELSPEGRLAYETAIQPLLIAECPIK